MKWGESSFDIAYLVIAVVLGIMMISKSKNKLGKMMGITTLVLGCGDAFHLVPRVLNYFVDYDFTMYLGVGKLVTSITMTVFYIFMYYIYLENYDVKENKVVTYSIWGLSLVRVILCLFPQNNWLTDSSPLMWDILRNIPFIILGGLIVVLYFKMKNEDKIFKNVYLLVTLSILFYIPVVVGTGAIPMLGMLMLPKTICYVLIMFVFNKKLKEL